MVHGEEDRVGVLTAFDEGRPHDGARGQIERPAGIGRGEEPYLLVS